MPDPHTPVRAAALLTLGALPGTGEQLSGCAVRDYWPLAIAVLSRRARRARARLALRPARYQGWALCRPASPGQTRWVGRPPRSAESFEARSPVAVSAWLYTTQKEAPHGNRSNLETV